MFWPKRVKWSFYTKSVPISRSLETMPQVCFSETRFFNEHFTLFRRSHPGPARPCFNGPKFVWRGSHLPHYIYILLSFSLHSLTVQVQEPQPFLSSNPRQEWVSFHLLLPRSPKIVIEIKIRLHHHLPLLSSSSLIPFLRNPCTVHRLLHFSIVFHELRWMAFLPFHLHCVFKLLLRCILSFENHFEWCFVLT